MRCHDCECSSSRCSRSWSRFSRPARRARPIAPRCCARRQTRWAWRGGPTSAPIPRDSLRSTSSTRWSFQGSGTSDSAGRAVKIEYHVGARLQPAGDARGDDAHRPDGGAPQRTIQTVRENYAWDESEIGSRSGAGKGHRHSGDRRASGNGFSSSGRSRTAWSKAALAAGDKTTVSTEGGATVITFP